MNTIKLVATCCLLLSAFTATAQSPQTVQRLRIGDPVPAIFVPKMMNIEGQVEGVDLSRYHDRLLILDLMDTRCSACISGLPAKERLQQEFGDQIKIIVATPEKEDYMRKYLADKEGYLAKHGVQLPWVIEDKQLCRYFPYWSISHLVWIYKGTVVAITTQEYVDAKNIRAILSGEIVNLPLKGDIIGFDYEKTPVFAVKPTALLEEEVLSPYYSALSGYQSGLDGGFAAALVDTLHQRWRLVSLNQSIFVTYVRANGGIHTSGEKQYLRDNRLILEVKDPVRYEYKKAYGYRESWNYKNAICYEGTFPLTMSKEACYQQMVNDLNRSLNLDARWEERKVPCLVIVRKEPEKQIRKRVEMAKQNGYIALDGRYREGKNTQGTLLSREVEMATLPVLYDGIGRNAEEKLLPLVDESDFKGALILPSNTFDRLSCFRENLRALGFDLIEAEREVEMFVITER